LARAIRIAPASASYRPVNRHLRFDHVSLTAAIKHCLHQSIRRGNAQLCSCLLADQLVCAGARDRNGVPLFAVRTVTGSGRGSG
jgi:hypothetical protein